MLRHIIAQRGLGRPPALRASGGHDILRGAFRTASIAGLVGSWNRSYAYSASQGGVIALTRAMAIAYASQGVRVNAICPGGVDTPMIAPLLHTAERRQRSAAAHPLGRLGTPADIAQCALYLASDESSWVTGAIFTIDGGITAS